MAEVKLICDVFVPGRPVPKARARVRRTKSGAAYAYNTRATSEAQENIRKHLMAALTGVHLDTQKALQLYVQFLFNGKGREGPHTMKPDCSNLVKLVEDALQPWIGDDCRIYRAGLEKVWTSGREGTLIMLYEVAEEV